MGVIDDYLKKFGMTRYQVTEKTGIPKNTLANADKKSASRLSVKVVQALAEATDNTPGAVLDTILKAKTKP
jgi:hypothetical protein